MIERLQNAPNYARHDAENCCVENEFIGILTGKRRTYPCIYQRGHGPNGDYCEMHAPYCNDDSPSAA